MLGIYAKTLMRATGSETRDTFDKRVHAPTIKDIAAPRLNAAHLRVRHD